MQSLDPGDLMANAGAEWMMYHPGFTEADTSSEPDHPEMYRLKIEAGGSVGAGLPEDLRKRIDAFLSFVPSPPFRL